MKKKINQKGFALVETLVVATFVLTIFVMLIANYYPLMGKMERYSNYDEVENIYIAYHLVNLVQENSTIFDNIPQASGNDYTLVIYSGNKTDSNYLCNFLSQEEKCERYLKLAGINKIYVTNYSTEPLKNNIDTISNVSRSFELYVKYISSYKNSATKFYEGTAGPTKEQKLDRVIIERKVKVDDDESGKYIYKYANYEIVTKGV